MTGYIQAISEYPVYALLAIPGPICSIERIGSWNRQKLSGYKIVRIKFDDKGKLEGNSFEDFVAGWLPSEDGNEVWGRPVGLLVAEDGSLLIADDGGRKIWRVSYGK